MIFEALLGTQKPPLVSSGGFTKTFSGGYHDKTCFCCRNPQPTGTIEIGLADNRAFLSETFQLLVAGFPRRFLLLHGSPPV